MKKQYYSPEKDGFYGVYYPCPASGSKAVIAMLGNSSDNRMIISAVKWLHKQGCSVMAMSPEKKNYGHHSYPLERIERAVQVLKDFGHNKIGIVGASTTGMVALVAASLFSDITLTLALTPPDFIMEGFYQDGKDGAHERPGDNESSLTWQGQPLPYLPYAYRHPEYWQKIKEESKETHNRIACRKMFDMSERLHPVQEKEKIKVENIKGKLIFVGAEDDMMWDTCKYIRRMEERLKSLPHQCEVQALIYKHGTHLVFPQSMITNMLPIGSDLLVGFMFEAGRTFPKECKETRIDIDKRLSQAIKEW